MHQSPDAFSKSRGVEFVRSPGLERGHPAAVGVGSVAVLTDNLVSGFHSPSGPTWLWYPRLRVRADALGEHREILWRFDLADITQNTLEPIRFVVSQSVGWPPAGQGPRATPVIIGATELTHTVEWRFVDPGNPANVETETVVRTLEGTPFDARAYRDLWWTTVLANQDVWPVAPVVGQNIRTLQSVLQDGTIVSQGNSVSTTPAFSHYRVTGFRFTPSAIDTLSEAFRTNLELRYLRRQILFEPVGEAVNGAFGDFDFDGVSVAIDCTRALTASIEKVIPPRIPQETLDAVVLEDVETPTFNFLATSERRLIPPDAAHALITC